ncbi:MAG: alpha/beta hydrolase [Pseudomonadota bacterium]
MVAAFAAIVVLSIVIGFGRRLDVGAKVAGVALALLIIALPFVLIPQLERARTASAPPINVPAPEDLNAIEPRAGGATLPKPAAPTPVPTTAPPAIDLPDAPEVASAEETEAVDAQAGRVADGKFDTVEVLFGTDREVIRADRSDAENVSFGAGRARKLTLGASTVSIPKDHTPGLIERPWEVSVFSITLYRQKEDPAKHFTVQKLGILDEPAFIAAANAALDGGGEDAGTAVVFVHGYNNDFESALFRTAQLAYDMRFTGAPFMYSWPSAAGYTTYEYDQQSARQASDHLRAFIEIVARKTQAQKVHLVAHSMGNDVLMEALRELRFRYGTQEELKLSQVILAAPDVDRDVFKRLARQIRGISDGVTLYASANDRALQISRTYAGGIARAGDVPEDGPVVLPGVDTIDVSETQQAFLSANHNSFAEASELVKDISALVRTGVRPPARRTPSLVAVPSGAATYWRFPGP